MAKDKQHTTSSLFFSFIIWIIVIYCWLDFIFWVFFFGMLHFDRVALSSMQYQFYLHYPPMAYVFLILQHVFRLAGSVYLLFLRKVAVYLLFIAFLISLGRAYYHVSLTPFLNVVDGKNITVLRLVVTEAIAVGILFFLIYLKNRKILY